MLVRTSQDCAVHDGGLHIQVDLANNGRVGGNERALSRPRLHIQDVHHLAVARDCKTTPQWGGAAMTAGKQRSRPNTKTGKSRCQQASTGHSRSVKSHSAADPTQVIPWGSQPRKHAPETSLPTISGTSHAPLLTWLVEQVAALRTEANAIQRLAGFAQRAAEDDRGTLREGQHSKTAKNRCRRSAQNALG